MMYHFMLGLRGCSDACTPSAGGGACIVASLLVSSAIIIPADPPARTSTLFLADELQQVAQPELDHLIDHFKISGKDEDSNNDHCGRRLNFLASGVVDLLHLGADVVEELFGASSEESRVGDRVC